MSIKADIIRFATVSNQQMHHFAMELIKYLQNFSRKLISGFLELLRRLLLLWAWLGYGVTLRISY